MYYDVHTEVHEILKQSILFWIPAKAMYKETHITIKEKPTAKVQYSIYNLVDYVSVCTHHIQMLYRY